MTSRDIYNSTIFNTVKDRLKAVPVDEFGEHVQRMHADRDKWFELEYNVCRQSYNVITKIP